MKNEIS